MAVKNVTSAAFSRFWQNLSTQILPRKVDVVDGKGLSTNDLTDELLAKLEGIEEGANKYTHPTSGVEAGTYRSVTVDANGHVTAGTNPTTLDDYGITEVEVEKLKGVIDIQNIPAAAIERIYVAETEEARLALTTDDVQNGDTVKVTETDLMYAVIDDSKLGTEDAFMIYTAGAASSVPWSGVTDKPESMKNPYAVTISNVVTAYSEGVAPTLEDVEYDGSVAKSVDLAATVLNIMKAASNGDYEAASDMFMTADEVDEMMGVSASDT